MKKVLILSYFFPPCQLTAAQRSYGWVKCLKKEGWDPILITRNWEHPIALPDDMHHDSGTKLIIEKTATHETHYVPFRGNFRDRLYAKHGKSKHTLLRKALSFSELLLHHFYTKVISFSNLYDYALDYCKKNKDVDMILVTGNPFEIFRFGWMLHKNTGIPWIADYRDDWTTSEINNSRGFADGILRILERRSERKWVGSASAITSISPYYVNKISAFTKRPGQVILNGFLEEDFIDFQNQKLEEKFTVVYNGMLYPSQQIEVFLDAFKKLADTHPKLRNRIKLRFPGILFLKHVAARVENYMKGYEDLIELTERISRKEVLQIQAKAHLLLMVSHKGTIGIPSSKIYEYLGLGKTVMVCPGDKDILDETFEGYNLGYIAYSADEAYAQLEILFNHYLHGEYENLKPDWTYIAKFSRDKQAAVLAEFMRETLEHSRK